MHAGREFGDALTDSDDVAGALKAQHAAGTRRRVVEPPTLDQVGAVDARSDDPDQDLAWGGLGLRDVDNVEGVDTTRSLDDYSTHPSTVAARNTGATGQS
jgi:hypothetical protein